MKKHSRLVFITIAFLLGLSVSAPAAEPPSNTAYTADKKFHRGVNNAATGWLEAPVTVDKFHRERNLFEALTTGLTRGVGLAIARTGVGIYEAATFPFAAPERYEPLMMPEKVEG